MQRRRDSTEWRGCRMRCAVWRHDAQQHMRRARHHLTPFTPPSPPSLLRPAAQYHVSKDVYAALFGRKGMFNSFYGLMDMSKLKMAESKKRGVTGNFAGDGFQLGGQFVMDTDGSVLLEHRQGFFGDDEGNEELMAALKRSKAVAAAAPQ